MNAKYAAVKGYTTLRRIGGVFLRFLSLWEKGGDFNSRTAWGKSKRVTQKEFFLSEN